MRNESNSQQGNKDRHAQGLDPLTGEFAQGAITHGRHERILFAVRGEPELATEETLDVRSTEAAANTCTLAEAGCEWWGTKKILHKLQAAQTRRRGG